MNPFALELVCRELKMTDGALIDIKKKLRLARNNEARLRRENAKLRVEVFNYRRDLGGMAKEIAKYLVAMEAIYSAVKSAGH